MESMYPSLSFIHVEDFSAGLYGESILYHDPLLIPVNGLVKLLEDLLNREALFAPNDLEHIRHLFDNP